jgi:hypothetical protein
VITPLFSLRREQEGSSAQAINASAKMILFRFDLDKKSRRFPAPSCERLTGRRRDFHSAGERRRPGVRPEHLDARRSKGCKSNVDGQVSWLRNAKLKMKNAKGRRRTNLNLIVVLASIFHF